MRFGGRHVVKGRALADGSRAAGCCTGWDLLSRVWAPFGGSDGPAVGAPRAAVEMGQRVRLPRVFCHVTRRP
eukprot:969410-Prymnesium_polylepis.1